MSDTTQAVQALRAAPVTQTMLTELATQSRNCFVILGATATGKTAYAVDLAKKIQGEIISADSRQVYRGMDIGSGKDLESYGSVPYHLIDIVDPSETYTVFHFQKDAYRAFTDIIGRGHTPIIAGGSGLYLEALIKNYPLIPVPHNETLRASLQDAPLKALQEHLYKLKKNLHNTSDLHNKKRLIRAIEIETYIQANPQIVAEHEHTAPDIQPKIIGIQYERTVLRKRIAERLDARLASGLIEETKRLHEDGLSWERLEYFGLEYRFTAQYLQNKFASKDEYRQKLYYAICQFAKRQATWFRRMERNGITIHWLYPHKN